MNLHQLLKQSTDLAREHVEYVKNKDFNDRLDNGEIEGYELVLRKPDGEEQTIAPLSAALFVSDLPTYQELRLADISKIRNETLNVEQYPNNENAYERLLAVIQRQATVIPFIGAGFSVNAGCPSWVDYVIKQARLASMDEVIVRSRLKEGGYVSLIDEVVRKRTMNIFERDFKSTFEGRRITPTASPSAELVGLFDSCTITTNFDRVLEDAHSDQLKPYIEKVMGVDNTGRFLKAIFSGEKYLLKLHGNIDEPRDRVLTQSEYNNGYGSGVLDHTLPIPRTLSKVFGSYTVLFLGCSLIGDRYLDVLRTVCDKGRPHMPEHFSILTAPDDENELKVREQFLANHGITPIWFSEGDWECPSRILKLLKLER